MIKVVLETLQNEKVVILEYNTKFDNRKISVYKKGGVYYGKVLVIEFSDNKERIFKKILEWLSNNFSMTALSVKQQQEDFLMNPFTRTVIDRNGNLLFLTSKEFDLLYFLYSHKGQVFTKEQLYENVWGFENMPKDTSNLPSFIRKLRKR